MEDKKEETQILTEEMEENRIMEENIREEAAVKTVYIKEKKRTGWWKIVMLILTILITLTFAATALFAGLGSWQLYRIAENQEQMKGQQIPGGYIPFGNGSYNDDDYYQDSVPETGNDSGYQADGETGIDNIDLDDILEFFGYNGENGSGNTGNSGENIQNPGSSENNTGKDWKESISGWMNDLFGGSGNNDQNTQGF